MSTKPKTTFQMMNDSCVRAQEEPINVYEYDEDHYTVINEKTNGEYIIEVDNDNCMVISCTCPHFQFKCSQKNIYCGTIIPCKHMVAVANYLGYNW